MNERRVESGKGFSIFKPVRPLLESLNRNKWDILSIGLIVVAIPAGVATLGYSFHDPYMIAAVPKIVVAEAVGLVLAVPLAWLTMRSLRGSDND